MSRSNAIPSGPRISCPDLKTRSTAREDLVPQFVVFASIIPERRQHRFTDFPGCIRLVRRAAKHKKRASGHDIQQLENAACRHFVPCS